MNRLEKKYKNTLLKVLDKGIKRNDRTGVGCKSIFNVSFKWDLKRTFPMFTGRRIYQKVFDTEFDWFINGETNIKRFQDNNIKIWDAWADNNGNLGPVYGYQLRQFNGSNIDQLTNVIDSINNNPDSRRHIISLWNPLQTKDMKLPPCYHNFQFFVEGDKLNLFVLQRSGDLFLGIPYDIALFSKLLLYVAEKTNKKANKINLNIVDAHVYNNQVEAVKEYLATKTYKFPKFSYISEKLIIKDYKFDKVISCEVAV